MELFDVYSLLNVTPQYAKDVFVFDEKGTKYLDLYGGHAVISIGHSQPKYVENIKNQLQKIAFYSNSIMNPLQNKLAQRLGELSQCETYNLFLCNSGAEANENALKLASFYTKKSKVLAFKNSFHGRTSAAVSVTDNAHIIAPINNQHQVVLVDFNDINAVERELSKGDFCAVIIEIIQGVGGLDEAESNFCQQLAQLCSKWGVVLIADEVQSGFGRTGDFFAFQNQGIQPDIISMAKGMGNGFPIGGILVHPKIKAQKGMLGTTFGGNHLACVAALTVLEVIEAENLMQNATDKGNYFVKQAVQIPQIKNIKGRGLMLGVEFDFPIDEIRKEIIYKHHIFTGNAKPKNLLRILPSLTVKKKHLDIFFDALRMTL